MTGTRRFQAYCVGAGKTGTHSIAGLFARHFRAGHEAESEEALELILESLKGQASESRRRQFLRDRDARLGLEMDSSLLNSFFIDDLVTLFPQACFLLTLRDPVARLDSYYNHLLNESPPSGRWAELRKIGDDAARHPHHPAEAELVRLGLPSVDSVLSSYNQFFERATRAIPADRLLVVRTDAIAMSLAEIARLVGINPELLEVSRAHEFKAGKKHGVLSRMPGPFLFERVRMHCGRMLEAHFPEHCRGETSG